MRALIHETGAEILKSLRAPEFLAPTLIMPVAFYSLFAIAMPGSEGRAAYLLGTYGVFAVMGPSIFGFGVGVATERERGWFQLKRVAPVSGGGFLTAKILSTLIFAAAALVPIYAIAGWVGGVGLSRPDWLALFALHVLSAIPMVLIGLTLGFTFGANGAVAVCNILFLGLAALGGLWMPIFLLPDMLQHIAQFLPSYHLGELSLSIVNPDGGHDPGKNAIAIGLTTIILAGMAALAWSRQK